MASSTVAAFRVSHSTLSVFRLRCHSYRWAAGFATHTESTYEEPRSVQVEDVKDLLDAGHHYVDVRTSDEFTAGHTPGAINIPYMFRKATGMDKNPKFLEEISSSFSKDETFLLGCQSGRRSLMAAYDLHSEGYRYAINVAGGYTAWVQRGLPTSK